MRDDDLNCYAHCGFPGDCATCTDDVQNCGIGLDISLNLHPGSPCYPPMD